MSYGSTESSAISNGYKIFIECNMFRVVSGSRKCKICTRNKNTARVDRWGWTHLIFIWFIKLSQA